MPTPYILLTSLKVSVIGRDTFSVITPILGPSQKMSMPPSSTVHGGQHDTKYVAFQLLMHAAFVADEIWGFMLEPARTQIRKIKFEF